MAKGKLVAKKKKRFKDNLIASLKAIDVNPARFEEMAADRRGWRNAVKCGAHAGRK
jgi:hypothetical protein